MTEDLEAIRLGYRPEAGIRVLLIGESPPRGRGFFYTGDSMLFRASVPVFAERCDFPSDPEAFLRRFAEVGFYLDHLSTVRGDHPGERPEADDVLAARPPSAEASHDETAGHSMKIRGSSADVLPVT